VQKAESFVCFVGRYAECKGPHLAVDAARIAGVPIRVAGEVHPPDREFAAAELASRLQQPHVTELGCIGIDRKVPLLRDARALLTPITWEEPFGLILIEAMLSGCPVVSFPRGSAPELIEQGVTGYLVNNLEEMAEVIRPGGVLDYFDRKRCQRVARERFGRERMVADHLRLYRTAIHEWASALSRQPHDFRAMKSPVGEKAASIPMEEAVGYDRIICDAQMPAEHRWSSSTIATF
jgi:glycosyltransferase involved in cell wall biosynthesis